jgi:hypothetical protein
MNSLFSSNQFRSEFVFDGNKRIELLLTQRNGYYQIPSWSSEFHLPIQPSIY